MAYSIPPSLSANKILTASQMNLTLDDLRIIGGHNHSGSLGEGSDNIQFSGTPCALVYRYEFPFFLPASNSNWGTSVLSAKYLFYNSLSSNSACSASLKYPVTVACGTYSVGVIYDDTVGGSMAIWLNGASLGSIDAGTAGCWNTPSILSNISVSITGSTTLEFTHASGQSMILTAVKLRRTGVLA